MQHALDRHCDRSPPRLPGHARKTKASTGVDWAHPTARQIGRRQPIQLDLDAVCRAATENGVVLEINAQPERLDLDDTAWRRAIELGVLLAIDTDAHSTAELRFMRWGVDQARRGWAERRHVLNTKPLTQLLGLLKR